MPDPSIIGGNREVRLEAYRDLRERLEKRLRERFPRYDVPSF